MSVRLKILLVDDNPDDRLLVRRELEKNISHPLVTEISDPASFASALAGPPPDLAITDYQLHWSNGLTILEQIKAQWPGIPVIMFTGTGTEEIAVAAMKAGLDDYILKTSDHYSRVPAAAQLAIRVADQRREIAAIELRYEALFTSVPVGLYRLTRDAVLYDANPAFIDILGFPDRDALLKTRYADLFIHQEQFLQWRQSLEIHGLVRNFEAQLRRADGSVCWVKDSARVVHPGKSGSLIFEGGISDITEQKRAEEEREKLIVELQDALAEIKTLNGLLPICASCKKIRDDKGYWNQIEVYIESHSDAEFTHSFCPDCVKRLYPEVAEESLPKG